MGEKISFSVKKASIKMFFLRFLIIWAFGFLVTAFVCGIFFPNSQMAMLLTLLTSSSIAGAVVAVVFKEK